MKDSMCIIDVGNHEPPYWKDTTRKEDFIVCSIHKQYYETAYDDYGPFNWIEFTTRRPLI